MTVILALLAIVVALLAILVAGLLRTNAEVLQALHRLGEGIDGGDVAGDGRTGSAPGIRRRDRQPGAGSRTGRPALDISGPTPDGGAHAVRVTDGGRQSTLLLFLSSGCLTCEGFWDRLATPSGLSLPDGVRAVVVTKGEDRESPAEVLGRATTIDAPVVMSSQAWLDYEVPGSPYVVLVDGADGRVVGEGTGSDWPQVARMMAQASGDLSWVGEDTPRVQKAARDTVDEHDTDAALLQAGITPGDASLYPASADADRDGTTGTHA